MVLDIGGATIDVHSMSDGKPSTSGVVVKGLPEPRAKRTVEADLGVRYNAGRLLELVGREKLIADLPTPVDEDHMVSIIDSFHMNIGRLPETEEEISVETAMSRAAVEIAVERNVGHLEVMHFAHGDVIMQKGKDLTAINTVIGSGGPIIFSPNRDMLFQGTLFDRGESLSPQTQGPHFFIDEKYILYAIGLLASELPKKALRIMKRYVRKIEKS